MSEELQSRIEALSRELLEKSKELNELRLQLPPEPVQDYILGSSQGAVRLSELFGERRDLIVVHNMGSRCPYCTLWADGLIGLLPHISSRAAFALCSPDTPQAQATFARRRGWPFRMVSAANSEFTRVMGFQFEEAGETRYMPGYSTFRRRDDGTLVRVAFDHFGPGDVYCGVWHMFALLEGGAGDWGPRLSYP